MAELKKATNSVSQEDTTDPKFALATEGLYRHPESGAELAAFWDPITGNAQAQGLTRVGFERVGDVPTGYDKTVVVNHDFAGADAKGVKVSVEEQAASLMAAVKLLQDEKNASEDKAAKATDNSSDEADELQLDKVKQDGADKVAAQETTTPAGVNTVTEDESSKVRKAK